MQVRVRVRVRVRGRARARVRVRFRTLTMVVQGVTEFGASTADEILELLHRGNL